LCCLVPLCGFRQLSSLLAGNPHYTGGLTDGANEQDGGGMVAAVVVAVHSVPFTGNISVAHLTNKSRSAVDRQDGYLQHAVDAGLNAVRHDDMTKGLCGG
jgi:hypothetical protein